MTRKQLNPSRVYDSAPNGMSQGVVDAASGLVFVSGQVAWDVNGQVVGDGYGEQTKRALENLSLVLADAGCGARDVLSVRVYVRGEVEDHLEECVPALVAYFGETRPALTGIGVASLATRATLVEIEVVARVAGSA